MQVEGAGGREGVGVVEVTGELRGVEVVGVESEPVPGGLGHEVGSSNVASTTTLIFMKNAQGIQLKLNELYSRIFTLALRLHGLDVYAEFAYAPIDLRPESELEAFKSVKQSRVLELLSLGMLAARLQTLVGHDVQDEGRAGQRESEWGVEQRFDPQPEFEL